MLFAFCSISEAQQARKIASIGFLTVRNGVEWREEAFRQALREIRYKEGQNIVVEWRFANGNAARLPALAAELVGLKPDVIVTAGLKRLRPRRVQPRTFQSSLPERPIPLAAELWKPWRILAVTSQV